MRRLEKRLLIIVLISILAGRSIFFCAVKAQNADKPNIIFIMADDVGAECLQSYGGQSYQTPNLDQLADNGIRFTNAFTTPLCTPTRVQVMSGQYPFRNGWTGGIWNQPEDKQFLDPQLFNFARMLKNEGYATAVAGKWQLARFENQPDHPKNIGFDEYCLWTWQYNSDIPQYVNYERPGKPARFWNPGIWRNGEIVKDVKGKYGPNIYTDFLLDFIEKHQSEPFFIYFPMTLAHFPFVAVPGTEEGGSKQENFNHMIKYMDMLVGKFVKQLDELGISDNTLLIFTGDNGTDRDLSSRINGGTLQGGKGNLNDAGTRVPFLLKWPAVAEEGKVVDDLVDLSDVLPTFAEVSGAKIPGSHKVDGKSFLPIIKGEEGSRDWVFCQVGDNWFIRTKDFRFHNNGEFYHMKTYYSPEEVDLAKNREALRVKKDLIKVSESMGVK